VFKDQESADEALEALQNYQFYGKLLKINYAKKSSDVVSKMNFTFDEGEKAKRDERRRIEKENKEKKYKKKLIEKLLRLREEREEYLQRQKAAG